MYQSTEQLEVRVTPSDFPGRDAIYVFALEALDTSGYDLTPFYQGLLDEDESISGDDFVLTTSPLSNEADFTANPDGTITLRVPWLAVAFYGPNRVTAHAVDDNLYDFKRSEGPGGTTSPGERDNFIEHVENGRGIFGSMSSQGADVFIEPPAASSP